MDGIMFVDMLDHYNIKTKEIKAMLQDVVVRLENCSTYVYDGWKGKSGDAAKIRLDEVRFEADKASEALEHMTEQITSIISKCI